MDREKVIQIILKAAINNRLSCEKAHELSQELNVSLNEIGSLCNELKIKVAACQLGCF